MEEDNGKFYRERSWQLLVDEIKSLKTDLLSGLSEIRKEVSDLKEINITLLDKRINRVETKMYWIIGVGAGIVAVFQLWDTISHK